MIRSGDVLQLLQELQFRLVTLRAIYHGDLPPRVIGPHGDCGCDGIGGEVNIRQDKVGLGYGKQDATSSLYSRQEGVIVHKVLPQSAPHNIVIHHLKFRFLQADNSGASVTS